MDGPGTVFWSAGAAGSYVPNSALSNIVINGGALVLKSSFPLNNNQLKKTVITNNATLDYDPVSPDSQTLGGVISGSGQLIVNNGTLTLITNNTYTGTTTVSNGMLIINGSNAAAATIINGGTLGGAGTLSGPVTINVGAILAPGATNSSGAFEGDINSVGTLTINNDLAIGGNLAIDVDKTLSQSNDIIVVSGVLTNAGTGTVTVSEVGHGFSTPVYVAGDKFTLFNKPLQNGAALTVVGLSFNWVNNLAVDGSISIGSTSHTYTWTGVTDGTNISTAGNWSPVGLPKSTFADIAQWNGLTTSNLVISCVNGLPNGPPNQLGVRFLLTSNQTNSVQIIPVPTFAFIALIELHGITNNSPHSAFILGDSTANSLSVVTRPPGAVDPFVNNSTAACIINPNVNWLAGGGLGYTYDFSGTGNWIVNNYLMAGNFTTSPSTVQVDGPGTVFWSAGSAGSYTPNTLLGSIIINGGGLILQTSFPFNDNFTHFSRAAVSISTFLSYSPTNGTDSQTLSGVISGSGRLIVNGGVLTLGGNNTYSGGTVISNGVLQVGTNGAGGTLGTGNVTNNSSLIINLTGSLAVSSIYGTGTTTVSDGTLAVNSVGGNVNVSGGTLVPVGIGPVGNLNVGGNMTVVTGTVFASLNKSLSPSNSAFTVTGSLNSSGGTLKLLNFGPALVSGDKFFIFNKLVTGGAGMTIVSPGFTVNNNLGTDGSVTVATVQPAGSNVLTPTVSSGTLNLSWPSAWTGLHLQVQTNTLAQGLGTNWITIPNTDLGNTFSTTMQKTNEVFYRLAP